MDTPHIGYHPHAPNDAGAMRFILLLMLFVLLAGVLTLTVGHLRQPKAPATTPAGAVR